MKNTKKVELYYNVLTMYVNTLNDESRTDLLAILKAFGNECNIGNFNFTVLCSLEAKPEDIKQLATQELNIQFD